MEDVTSTTKSLQLLACSHPACDCTDFGHLNSRKSRFCASCQHSYLLHALRAGSGNMEDVVGLILFGTTAIPVRTKILLDQLFESISNDEMAQMVSNYDWTAEEVKRGYKHELEFCSILSRDEELVIAQQLLHFDQTKSLAEEIVLSEIKDRQESFARAVALQTSKQQQQHALKRKQHSDLEDAMALMSKKLKTDSFHHQQAIHESERVECSGGERNGPLSALMAMHRGGGVGAARSPPPLSSIAHSPSNKPLDIKYSSFKLSPPSSIHPNNGVANRQISSRPSTDPVTYGYGGTVDSASGKKRVLCALCNKTFCDKGALKIHHSAVHLKEMHKCSIDGCNMWFSSRRSRNRHSSNLNPKLHSPYRSNGQPIYNIDRGTPWKKKFHVTSLDFGSPVKAPSSVASAATRDEGDMDDEAIGGLHGLDEGEEEGGIWFDDGNSLDDGDAASRSVTPPRIVPHEEDAPDNLQLQSGLPDEPSSKRRKKSVPMKLIRSNEIAFPTAAPISPPSSASSIAVSPVDSFCDADEDNVAQLDEIIDEDEVPDLKIDQSAIEARNIEFKTAPQLPSGVSSLETVDVPTDPNNSKICLGCGKSFQNHFSMKLHYQNVHLKLMHPCTIDGCNSMFPSKRSRDRHSQNLNLHYRLMVNKGHSTKINSDKMSHLIESMTNRRLLHQEIST